MPEIAPDLASAKSLFSSALDAHKRQDFRSAEHLYREALACAPGRSSIIQNLSTLLIEQKKFDEVRELCTSQLRLNPREPVLWNQLGNAHLGAGDFEDALSSYAVALDCMPDNLEALLNSAYALERLGQATEALSKLNRLIDIDPIHVAALNNRGNMLTKLNRFDEALRDYARAQAIDPTAAISYWNESICRLLLGDYERGWNLYGWGWKSGQRGAPPPYFDQPGWNGADYVDTLLVWGEQGVGDQILFSSMLGDLKGRANRIIIALDHRLLPLLRRSFPDFEFIDLKDARSFRGIDQQIAIGDLGKFFRKALADFPSETKKFLQPDATRAETIRKHLRRSGAFVCGFSWLSTNPSIGRFKSMSEADLSPLGAIRDAHWVDLQYGDTRKDLDHFRSQFGLDVHHLDDIDNLNDIDGLAALISTCDLVVTASNTTAHLAGALGVPTMVMLPNAVGKLWYWHHDLPSSPWYPSCRLIRQAVPGDWASVLATAADEIRKIAADHKSTLG